MKRLNQLLRILLPSGVLALCAAGCTTDGVDDSRSGRPGAVELVLGVSVSGDKALSRAMTAGQESEVAELTALVFDADDDGYRYTAKTQVKGPGEYRILLERPVGSGKERLYLVLLANLDEETRKLLPSSSDVGVSGGTLLERIVSVCEDRWPAQNAQGEELRPIPMWAQSGAFEIDRDTEEADVKLAPVSLLRALARLDLKIDDTALDGSGMTFTPTAFFVCNARTSGRVSPDPAVFDASGRRVTAPTVPSGSASGRFAYAFPEGSGELVRTIYLFEAPADDPVYGILEGVFSSPTLPDPVPCYYYVGFRGKDDADTSPVLRNHRYTLVVPVKGPGAVSEEDALKGTPVEDVALSAVPWTEDYTDDDSSMDLKDRKVPVVLRLKVQSPSVVPVKTRAADAASAGMHVSVLQYFSDGQDWVLRAVTSSLLAVYDPAKDEYVCRTELIRSDSEREQRIAVFAADANSDPQSESVDGANPQTHPSIGRLFEAYSVGSTVSEGTYTSSGISAARSHLTEGDTIGVNMVRALARIDFGVGMETDPAKNPDYTTATGKIASGSFEVTSVSLYNAYSRSALFPELGHAAAIEEFRKGRVSRPAQPGWRKSKPGYFLRQPVPFSYADNLSLGNHVGESPLVAYGDPAPIGADSVCESYLIVEGRYTGANLDGTSTNYRKSYYRIDFVCEGKPVPLLRNHRYIVNVVAVSGPGAARPEDATSENLTAEITVDDQNSAMDIVTDGHYYLGLNPRMLFFNGLGYPTETQYEGDLSTDAPAWTAALSEDYPKNWSSKYVLVDPSGGAGKNRRFVRVNDGTQDGRLPELVSDARQATVRVTAGNLADSLTIIQSPVTAEDFRLYVEPASCACYETEVPVRAYIDSRFASMAWSAGSFWPSGSAVPGHSFYLGETSGVFDGGIQGSGPQQGKAFREVKGRFNTYNNTANDIVVGAKFSLTGYTHAAVSGSALVTQHAAEKTPLRVKVTYRVRYSSVNPVTGTFYYGSETNGSSAIYSVASGSATQTIEFPNEPDLVFYTTSNMERWGNNFTRGVVIQLAPDCEIPEADISMTSGAGAVSSYAFSGGSDLSQFLSSDKFMFVPSGVTENKTITKSQSNRYYLLVPEMTYLKADASATVTVSTKCGQSLKLVFSRKKAVPALEAVPAEFTVPNTKGSDRIAVRVSPKHMGWTVSSDASWLTATPAKGYYSPDPWSVQINYEANTGGDRTGHLTFRHQDGTVSKIVTVHQTTGVQSLSVSPASLSFVPKGGSQQIQVTTENGGGWKVQSKPDWITLTPAGGSGGKVTVACAKNSLKNDDPSAVRKGEIVLVHTKNAKIVRKLAVSQPHYYFKVEGQIPTWVSADGGSYAFTITTRGTTWSQTATSGGWLSDLSPSKGGDETSSLVRTSVTYKVQPNRGSADEFSAPHRQGYYNITWPGLYVITYCVDQYAWTGDPGIMIMSPVYSTQANTCPPGYRMPRYGGPRTYDYTERLKNGLIVAGLDTYPGYCRFYTYPETDEHSKWYNNMKPVWFQPMGEYSSYPYFLVGVKARYGDSWTIPDTFGGINAPSESGLFYPWHTLMAFRVCLKKSVWGN
ncbi:BACON domain-containing protein [uncultured Alistipes sp.]|uniref:BACON domain-containing protein n=1 Tax=uncultured Alistipes sp. TaxID=538949 RepID=UPI002666F7B1|nr:BACON domain-containing protein [uncultured Alistipes sp.]